MVEEARVGEKRKRDEKAEEKENPEKRQKIEDKEETKGEPMLQFKKPFKLYSRSVNSVQTLKTTFGTIFGSIVLPEEGYYTINLQSMQES